MTKTKVGIKIGIAKTFAKFAVITTTAAALTLTACGGSATKAAPAGTPAAALAFSEAIAAPGHSEVVVDNRTNVPLNIIVGGRNLGTVPPRAGERVVIADGNHTLQVQSAAGGETSRGEQFFAQSKRVIFRATSSNPTTFHLARENIVDITPVQGGVAFALPVPAAATTGDMSNVGSALATAQAQEANVRSAEDQQLFDDRDRFFDRMDGHFSADQSTASLSQRNAPAAPTPVQTAAAPTQVAANNMGTTTVITSAQAQPAAAPAQTRAPAQVGVYVVGEMSRGERRALSNQILVSLVNTGRFVAVERSEEFLNNLDNEFEHQMSSSVDENQIRMIGRQFGVEFVCVASISRAFGSYQVSARVINLETAVVVAAAAYESPLASVNDLVNVSTRIARELVRRMP